MPNRLQDAVEKANNDSSVHVILLTGAGRLFCAGWDLKLFAETPRPVLGSQNMPWDPIVDFQFMNHATSCFMSLWRSLKPVVAKVKGFAVAGGSDIALCCDIVVMENDARIGYPPARVWGCPTTFMWAHRVGLTWAKKLMLTGDLIDGISAARINLVTAAVPKEEIDCYTDALVGRIASVPKNQLAMHKLVINSAFEQMGLLQTQRLATFFDGVARHSPEGIEWKEKAEKFGIKQAIKERDEQSRNSLSAKL
jgi:enoyl-CoA hydratase